MKLPTIKSINDWFDSLPLVVKVLDWSKKRSFPGFFGVPIYEVIIFMYQEMKSVSLSGRANSIAYSFFLSVFPSIIVLLTLLPLFTEVVLQYIPEGDHFFDVLYREIKFIMPGSAGDMVFETIQDLTTRPRNGLLSFGFILVIYFSSNGMLAMMTGFEKSHLKTFKKRGSMRSRGVAIGLTFVLGFMLIASVVLIILGNYLINLLSDYIKLDWFGEVSLSLLRYMIILALFYAGISVLYRYGASLRKRFSFFSPGATLATILSLLTTQLFSYYVEYFASYDKLYGSIGTIIIVMVWLQLNAMILLAGFELNASIAVNRDLKAERKSKVRD
ncbi:MAG: YihY/virulence factor BrkB family protein [Saprospirales bacterium]|nr:YihY/virulence factor BrkB family protein [Saprospirales bacterium]